MNFTLHDIAWHRSVGQLIDTLDKDHFWTALVRLLNEYVACDSWVALLFSAGRPQVFAECPSADGNPDPLFQDYLKGLYLLDPFYVASRESGGTGLVRLSDVAPECFEQTDYYQRYFRLNVVADEIQFNVQLDAQRTLCLSLGSKRRFSIEQVISSGPAGLIPANCMPPHMGVHMTCCLGRDSVGAGLPANTGIAGAIHRVACFAGMPAPTKTVAGTQAFAACSNSTGN